MKLIFGNMKSAAMVLGAGMAALASLANPSAADEKTDQLISKLQQGGYVIYLRHASTEKDYADQVSAEMGNCATQRVLSEKGWQEARTIGASMALLRIPVADVYSSQYCRAWQTADLAFGRHLSLAALNFEPSEEFTDEQMAAMANRVRPMLAKQPADGHNTIIVGHDDPFEAATGIYPEPQGVAYILKPDEASPEGFSVEGFIAPDMWPALLN